MSVPPLRKDADLLLMTEVAMDGATSDVLLAAARKSKIQGLINSTGLAARAAANYQSLQAALVERRRMEFISIVELQIEQQKKLKEKARAEAESRAKRVRQEDEFRLRVEKKRLEKLEFHPPREDYYDPYPVWPGLRFLQALCELSSRFLIPVNVPQTLIFHNSYTWMCSESGKLVVRKEFKVSDFLSVFPKPSDQSEFVAVLRITDERGYGSKVSLLTWAEVAEHIQKFSFPSFGLLQELVRSCSHRSTTMRLFHRREKAAATAIAFFPRSTKSRVSTNVAEEDVEAMNLGAAIVSQLTGIGDNIIRALERGFSLRISLLVLDFIRDTSDVYWLISCKGILFDAEMQVERDPLTLQTQKEQQLCAYHCKLCLLPYQNCEMTHVLPFRLLLLYKKHVALNSRQVLDLSHIRVNSMDFLSHSVPVCEICFMLITTEYELILAEERLANLLHIPQDKLSLTAEKAVSQPNFMPAVMNRWRVVFYLRGIDTERQVDRGFIHYSLFGRSHCWELPAKCASVRLAKMHYFFAPSGTATKSVCHNLATRFLLCRTDNPQSVQCQGELRPFSQFSFEQQPGDAVCQPLKVILFAKNTATVLLRMWVGIVCDKPVAVRKLPISIERVAGLYVPEASYKTAELLPTVWMEMFEDKPTLERTEILGNTEEIEAKYSPKMKETDFLAFSSGLDHVLHIGFLLDPLSSRKKPLKSPRKCHTKSASAIPAIPSLAINSPMHAFPSTFQVRTQSHEDTLEDLQALCPEQGETQQMARTVTEFLTKRPQSLTTRRILSRAQSVAKLSDDRLSLAPTEELDLLSGGTTLELLKRPPSSCRLSAPRSSSLTHVTKSLALAKTYGCL